MGDCLSKIISDEPTSVEMDKLIVIENINEIDEPLQPSIGKIWRFLSNGGRNEHAYLVKDKTIRDYKLIHNIDAIVMIDNIQHVKCTMSMSDWTYNGFTLTGAFPYRTIDNKLAPRTISFIFSFDNRAKVLMMEDDTIVDWFKLA